MHLFFVNTGSSLGSITAPVLYPMHAIPKPKEPRESPQNIQSKEIRKEIKYISYKDYPQVKGETRRNIMVVYNSFFPSPDKISGTKKAEP